MHGEIMIQDQKSQSDGNLDNGGKGKDWLYRHVVS